MKKTNVWKAIKIILSGLALSVTPILASAINFSGAVSASKIDTIFTGGIGPACVYLGAAIIVFGALQLGFAFRSEDTEGKAKGLRSAVAGALVGILGAALSGWNGATGTPLGALEFSTQSSQLNNLMHLIGQACIWIGAAIVVFGAVQFAFAFRSDEAEPKAKGMRSAISGVLVIAVGVAATVFSH